MKATDSVLFPYYYRTHDAIPLFVLSEGYVQNDSIHLYPNPTRGVLYTANTKGIAVESIRIYTLTGILALQFHRPTGNTIDLSKLPAACYVALITTGDNHLYRQTIFLTD